MFVTILNPIIPRLRASRWLGAFLDAVNISSVALMLAVTIKLALGIFILPKAGIDWIAALISIVAGHFGCSSTIKCCLDRSWRCYDWFNI